MKSAGVTPHIAQKFADCCSLQNYPARRLYRRMMESTKKRSGTDKANYQKLRKSIQSMFRTPSSTVSIVERNPEVLQFLKEFQPELDKILTNTPKSANWLSQDVPLGYWNNMRNQRNFFEWVAMQRGFKTDEDWYELTQKDVISFGGAGLLKKYNNTLTKALQAIYPERNWIIFLFKQVPAGYWDDNNNIRQYIQWLSEQLGIQTMENWYNVSYIQVSKHAGGTLLHKFGGIYELLKHCFPGYPWDPKKFALSSWGKTQSLLLKMVCDIFEQQHVDILTDHLHPKLLFSGTNKPMQLDIFIPQLNLAFEYQGQQHYQFHNLFGHPEEQKSRDAEKKAKCAEAGITLIEVPYWWDRNSKSLLATIHQKRPEVLPPDQVPRGSAPIAVKEKKERTPKVKETPSVAFHFMLPIPWNPSIAPAGWWLSEKYAGVRALWDNNTKTFQLRNGKIIEPPKMFTDSISSTNPNITQLDGVLWMGYGQQDELARRLADNTQDEDLWFSVQYLVFDIPNSSADLDERLNLLKTLGSRADAPLRMVDQNVCQGKEHLMKTLNEVISKGGDGLILKIPKSPYEQGSSASMLKVQTPEGKARLKSLNAKSATCELASGLTFDLPLTPPQIEVLKGQSNVIVSFKQTSMEWDGFTAPMNPSLLAVRKDLSWDNVLEESTPYTLAVGKPKGTPKCVGCKQELRDRKQYRVYLQSLFTPIGKRTHGALFQFCPKAECINKASQIDMTNSGMLIPKMQGVYVPPTLEVSPEKLQACVGLKLLSSRQL